MGDSSTASLPFHVSPTAADGRPRLALRVGISGHREPGMTGVWVGEGRAEKVCAIGVSARKWVTYHGLSLNVDLDLKPFYQVVPCGLAGKGVTSMARVLGHPVRMADVEAALSKACGDIYGGVVEPAS